MAIDTPQKLDEFTPHQLIDEIKQISEQFSTEVPGTRRNWPKSIRARILALDRLGIPRKRISELTAIPAATVFLWCRGSPARGRRTQGGFVELRKDTPTVGVSGSNLTVGLVESASDAFSLRSPNGFVFQGLRSIEDLVRVYRELSG